MLSSLQREARASRRRGHEHETEGMQADAAPCPPVSLNEVRERAPELAPWLERLDRSQCEAVLSSESALVRAPVGSGKTTVLVHKLLHAHLVEHVPLHRIAALTFTSRAAREIRERLVQMTGAAAPADLWLVGTFHGVARSMLAKALPVERVGRRPDFSVIDEEQCESLWRRVIERNKLRVGRRSTLRRRMELLGTGNAAPTPADPDLLRLVALAEQEKRACNVMDFDDLLDRAIELLPDAPAESGLPPLWILVDELQDCRPRELDLVRRLRGPETRIFAVGDPLQSIYGWRGSAPQAFDALADELGCGVRALPTSYRSTGNVLTAARAVLGLQPVASAGLHGAREAGEPVVVRRHHDEIAEALAIADRMHALNTEGVAWRAMAVLFRLNAQAEPLLRVLQDRGIPCEEGLARDEEQTVEKVRLLTLHAAKGLEFDRVFIAGLNQGVVPFLHGATDEAEERRLLFVGMTRAKDGLELSHLAVPSIPCAIGTPCPYLDALPAGAVVRLDLQRATPAVMPRRPAVSVTAPVTAPPSVASATTQASVSAAAASTAPKTAPDTAPSGDSPWAPGQTVRHARYGAGVVQRIDADTVDVDFGKMGVRVFPLRLCPLQRSP